jgi:hypothetical protein
MSITTKQIQNLRSLLKKETIAWSALNAEVRQLLIKEQLLTISTHRSRKSIYAPNTEALQTFLEQRFEELRGINWDSNDFGDATSRSELAAYSGNSKTKEIRSCPGFMVNSYEPIYAKLNGKDIVIAPEEGTMVFMADWEHFEIPQEVLVIGIENMENFRRIRGQRYLFPTDRPILFVSRYPQSVDLRNWLQLIPNDYLHFGDFDLAGMRIYETEFFKFLGNRASFFIPIDIESRLSNGSTERYNTQYAKFKNYAPQDKRLLPLYNMVNHYHRCYDQEGYIGRTIKSRKKEE